MAFIKVSLSVIFMLTPFQCAHLDGLTTKGKCISAKCIFSKIIFFCSHFLIVIDLGTGIHQEDKIVYVSDL